MQTLIRPDNGPEAAKLALKLVEWNFGSLCKQIFRSLIHHGRQSLAEVALTSGMKSPLAVKTALLILIQQNCVRVNIHVMSSGKEEYIYEADLPRVLHIIRIPLFLSILEQVVPLQRRDESKAILEIAFHHGRLTIAQLIEKMKSSLPGPDSLEDESIRKVVLDLIDRRLLERAPLCSLPPAPDTIHQKAQKKRPASRAQDDSEEGYEIAERARVRSDHFSLRFVVEKEDLASGKKSGRKRKLEEAPSHPILWRVNFEELNRKVYNSITIGMVRNNVGPKAARVIEAMLFADSSKDTGIEAGLIPTMTDSSYFDFSAIQRASSEIHDTSLKAAEIKDELTRWVGSNKTTSPSSHQALDGERSMPSLYSCIEMGESKTFKFRTPRALEIARNSSLLAVIEQRFGRSAKRIWNMLYTGGQMEQKAIAIESMLDNGEARELLYAMLRNGFVSLQDVPRNADRAPSRTFFTWRATLDMACTRVSMMLYRTANNLLSRMAHELESKTNTELLRRVQLVNQGRMDASQLNASQLRKLKATVRITESALIGIDSQIAMFSLLTL